MGFGSPVPLTKSILLNMVMSVLMVKNQGFMRVPPSLIVAGIK
jgi:hypothetical protein